MMWLAADYLGAIGNFLFSGIEQHPRLELLFVMFLSPLIMSAFQFWIQDSFLKQSYEDEEKILSARNSLTSPTKLREATMQLSSDFQTK
jgi:hypothetical protein